MNYAIPLQPRGFRRRLRLVWTIRCAIEFRRRLNGEVMYRGLDPWEWGMCWRMAQACAESESEWCDRDGWAWDAPAEAVQHELECWTE
jgi:hypothetical protein